MVPTNLNNGDVQSDAMAARNGGNDSEQASLENVEEERDIWACKYCHKTFPDRDLVKLHVWDYHVSFQPFVCKLCSYSGPDREALNAHAETHAADLPKVPPGDGVSSENSTAEKPEQLSDDTKNVSDFQLRSRSPDRPFKCHSCPFASAVKGWLVNHLHFHTKSKRAHKCDFCTYSHNKLKVLGRHMKLHPESVDESIPKKKYRRVVPLDDTLVSRSIDPATEKSSFRCTVCDFTAALASRMAVHLRTHASEKPFKCSYCDYSAALKTSLTAHEYSHSNEKPFKCELCAATFRNRYTLLYRHMKTHVDRPPFRCEFCPYACFFSERLNVHLRKHTGEKPFTCDQCEYSSSQLSNLKTHMRTHTGERPFACSICGKTFTQLGNLQAHEFTHSGEKQSGRIKEKNRGDAKPFKCATCDFSATQFLSLKLHIERNHVNPGEGSSELENAVSAGPVPDRKEEKRFHCDTCAYSTNIKQNFEKHEFTHLAEKPFKCSVCDYSATQLFSLHNHTLKHHKSDAD